MQKFDFPCFLSNMMSNYYEAIYLCASRNTRCGYIKRSFSIRLKHNYLKNLYKSLNYPKIITMEEAYKLVEEMIKLKQTIHQRAIIKVSHFRFSICDSFRYLGRLILCSGQWFLASSLLFSSVFFSASHRSNSLLILSTIFLLTYFFAFSNGHSLFSLIQSSNTNSKTMCKLQEKEKNRTLNHVIIFQTLQAALRFNSGPSPYE